MVRQPDYVIWNDTRLDDPDRERSTANRWRSRGVPMVRPMEPATPGLETTPENSRRSGSDFVRSSQPLG